MPIVIQAAHALVVVVEGIVEVADGVLGEKASELLLPHLCRRERTPIPSTRLPRPAPLADEDSVTRLRRDARPVLPPDGREVGGEVGG